MALTLVPKYVRAVAEQLNSIYRVFRGADPDSIDLRLNGGGRFAVHHSGTNAVVFQVTDAGATGSYAPGDITDPDIADQTIVNRHVNNAAAIAVSKLAHVGANNVLKSNGTQNVGGPLVAADIPNDSITSAKIVDDSIMNADINASAGIAITKLAHVGAGNVIRSNGTTNVAGQVVAGDIATGAVTSAKILDNEIVDGDINSNAAIAVTKIAHVGAGNVLRSNGTANQGGKVVSGDIADDTIVNADINSGAAIAYSKLALVGSIVNADVAAAAAIGLAKLAHVGTGNVLKSNGTANVGAQIVNADIAAAGTANIDGGKLADNSVPLGKLAGAATLGVAKLGEMTSDGTAIMFLAGIPNTYRRLSIQWVGRSTAAGSGGAAVGINFEASPSAGAYYHQRLYGAGAAANAQESLGALTYIQIAAAPTAGSLASLHASGTVDLPEYANLNIFKPVESRSASLIQNASGLMITDHVAGAYVTTAAISLVRIVVLSGTWAPSSRMTVYGWPS